MRQEEKNYLKKKVLEQQEFYKIWQYPILKLIKNPLKTIPFYILVLLGRFIKPFKVNATTFWGRKLKCYLPGENAVFYYGFIEANLTNFLINFLKEGDVFIDVGAYIGYYSLLASHLTGATGNIHSFEPTPSTFELLKENTCRAGNIVINNVAILNKKRVIDFVDYGPRYGAFNTFQRRINKNLSFLRNKENIIKVRTDTLDHYCEENKIKPTFVKLDAEGAEHLILRGMFYILQTIRPLISLEVAGGSEWKENCQKSIGILQKNKYLLFEIFVDGYLKECSPRLEYDHDNLVFVPTEKVKLIKQFLK